MLPIGPYTLRNRWILAPMAGVSEMPFRVMAFQFGAALCPTELVSAQGLMRLSARTMRYLRHDAEVERPYSLQIFGGEPEIMAKAAVVAKEQGAQIIDINMGCPVKKVTKTGAGSGLMCDPPRAGDLVRQIREATGLPVTAKIRAGWDFAHRNFLEMADVLGAAGVAALAIHPRTRAQGYSGNADWTCIADLKKHVGSKFPIIGNGDVKSPADANRMLEETGCDYVMIGRGALGRPWIFRELNGGEPVSSSERCDVVLKHFESHVRFVRRDFRSRNAEEAKPDQIERHAHSVAVHTFRKHLGWYAHGLTHAAAFRSEVNHLETVDDVLSACERFFSGAEVDARAKLEEYDVDYRQALG